MFIFSRMTLWERVRRLSPTYRKRRDAEMYAAFQELCRNPDMPCMIGGAYIPNGYGAQGWNPFGSTPPGLGWEKEQGSRGY